MNFIRYDEKTGVIVDVGFMDDAFIQQEIAEGKPTIAILNVADRNAYIVNLSTKEIEPINQATLATTDTPDNNNGATTPQ